MNKVSQLQLERMRYMSPSDVDFTTIGGVNVLEKKTKCYIYTCVSTAIQVDGYSLDVQKDKL